MASSSTADVLDEATTTLIAEVKQMKEAKTPQDVEQYIGKLQMLARHLQFRKWLHTKSQLPIEVRPNNFNAREYMDQSQIEAWIDKWTKNHAKNYEGRILRNSRTSISNQTRRPNRLRDAPNILCSL